jgi:Tfp pilus assembly protein PilE
MARERSWRQRLAFTLLDLMITLAIVGVLAAIAIPALDRFRMRATSAEAGLNLAAIHRAEDVWFSEFGYYIAAPASPASSRGADRQPFVDAGGFASLGWSPEGEVYFQYAVAIDAVAVAYTADAAADLDEDGVPQVWGYVHPDAFGVSVRGALSCTGVWTRSAGPSGMNLVGPCGFADGRSEF